MDQPLEPPTRLRLHAIRTWGGAAWMPRCSAPNCEKAHAEVDVLASSGQGHWSCSDFEVHLVWRWDTPVVDATGKRLADHLVCPHNAHHKLRQTDGDPLPTRAALALALPHPPTPSGG